MKNILVLTGALMLLAGSRAWSQGCVATGASGLMAGHETAVLSCAAPSDGSSGDAGDAVGPYLPKGRWQAALAWRWIHSHRHFVGSKEQTHREAEGSEVVNKMNLVDVSATYGLSERVSLTLGIPYFRATRWGSVRAAGIIVGRSTTESQGIGDIRLVADAWLWKPSSRPRGNVSVGLGIKFPTGEADQTDTATTAPGVTIVRSVDQSIQPGDGGTGIIVQSSAFRVVPWALVVYAQGSYLVNPRGNNGVSTGRSGLGESTMSVADQYVLRGGFGRGIWRGLAGTVGGRIEGVPPHDILGPSDGFRRPGFTVSVDPGLSVGFGANMVAVNVPIAIHRERQKSFADRQYGRHGDAAFADYSVQITFSRRF